MAFIRRSDDSDVRNITIQPNVIGGLDTPWSGNSDFTGVRVTPSGSLYITGSVGISENVTLNVSDIEIGAVEIKNATTDDRQFVGVDGNAAVQIRSGSNMLAIDAGGALAVSTVVASGQAGAFNFYSSSAYEIESTVKASAGLIYGVSGYSSGSAQFVLIYNSTALPVMGTAPVSIIKVSADSNFSWDSGQTGIYFDTGITISNSSTPDALLTGSANIWLNVTYK